MASTYSMAGLPRKYAKMGFKRGWAAYRKKRKAPKTPKKRTAKKAIPMARRSRRSRVRRFLGRRKGVIPLADGLTAIYTLDGMTDKRVGAAIENGIGAIAGTPGMSFENGLAHLQKGFSYAIKNPKDAFTNGAKNLALATLIRKGLGWVGVPRTVNFLGKKIQVR